MADPGTWHPSSDIKNQPFHLLCGLVPLILQIDEWFCVQPCTTIIFIIMNRKSLVAIKSVRWSPQVLVVFIWNHPESTEFSTLPFFFLSSHSANVMNRKWLKFNEIKFKKWKSSLKINLTCRSNFFVSISKLNFKIKNKSNFLCLANKMCFSRSLPLLLEIDARIFLDECTTEMVIHQLKNYFKTQIRKRIKREWISSHFKASRFL